MGSKVSGLSAVPARIVNVATDPKYDNIPIMGGAAMPIFIVNFDPQGSTTTLTGLIVGDYAGGNYTEILPDGSIILHGNARTWKDELQAISGAKLASPSADFEVDDVEGAVVAKISARYPADYIWTSWQLNHDWSPGTSVHPHIHWWQTTANTPNWLVGYRWQKNGATKTTAWLNLLPAANEYPWSAGTLNQITEFAAIPAPVGYGQVSDIIQVRLYRDYTNVSGLFGGGDPVNASQSVLNLDAHKEVDSLGSRLEYTK